MRLRVASLLLLLSVLLSKSAETTLSGEELAHAHCQRCHAFPSPSLLGKEDWRHGALRNMAMFLGVSKPGFQRKAEADELSHSGIFPDVPLITDKDWNSLVSYYVESAPADVAAQPIHPRAETLDLFRSRSLIFSADPPCTTLLQIDSARQELWIGDAQAKSLKLYSADGKVKRALSTGSGPVALTHQGKRTLVTLIGRILPSDERVGQVWELMEREDSWVVRKLLRGLRRPVKTQILDMDGDGIDDLLVASYGNLLGAFSWFKSTDPEGSQLTEHSLQPLAGTVDFRVYDWNRDGRPDLTVLRGQAQEGVEIYQNEGDGKFTLKKVIEFPPTYGSCRMELVDFDHDGVPEIVVVNGDKGDFPSGPRGYQGVRIFQRGPDGNFVERVFFPMYGAFGVCAADFDQDGDPDLALISFFPDYDRTPEESFVYLRYEGGWRFQPFVFTASKSGRWLVLDAGDIDGDGDIDIVLGSFVRGPKTIHIPATLAKDWEDQRLSVLLLENTLKSR